ncbi:MAG: flavodoxin [Crocinitomicaceae bacterium]|nr:flavodoxin [Crocinitomicaceae bacterium]|tara:strand:+ start:9372 stop:10022 length:651 start_codon:yes stop_codon:yes gene_type:complete
MFTDAELTILNHPLSNEARVLYAIGLRPYANQSTGASSPISYKQLLSLVNGSKGLLTLGREINQLISELLDIGLIALPSDVDAAQSLNGKVVLLPLMLPSNDFVQLHKQHSPMSKSWQPNPDLYNELCSLLGIIDTDYTGSELGEFIAYWMGRPEAVYSSYQWTQKFTYNMKQKRTAIGHSPVKKVGTQVVNTAPEITPDDNTRRLVEKYSKPKDT